MGPGTLLMPQATCNEKSYVCHLSQRSVLRINEIISEELFQAFGRKLQVKVSLHRIWLLRRILNNKAMIGL